MNALLSTVEIRPDHDLVHALNRVYMTFYRDDGSINISAFLDPDALTACIELGEAARVLQARGPRIKTVVD